MEEETLVQRLESLHNTKRRHHFIDVAGATVYFDPKGDEIYVEKPGEYILGIKIGTLEDFRWHQSNLEASLFGYLMIKAYEEPGEFIRIDDIAQSLDINENKFPGYLGRLRQRLTNNGYIITRRRKRGDPSAKSSYRLNPDVIISGPARV